MLPAAACCCARFLGLARLSRNSKPELTKPTYKPKQTVEQVPPQNACSTVGPASDDGSQQLSRYHQKTSAQLLDRKHPKTPAQLQKPQKLSRYPRKTSAQVLSRYPRKTSAQLICSCLCEGRRKELSRPLTKGLLNSPVCLTTRPGSES